MFCLKTFNYEDKIIAQGAYLPPLMSGNQKQAARTYSFIHTKVGNNNNKERKKERTEEKKTLEKCSTFNINQTTFFLSGEWRPSGQCYKNLPDRKGCRGRKSSSLEHYLFLKMGQSRPLYFRLFHITQMK